MILIKNKQRKIKFSTESLKQTIKKILDVIDYNDFDITVLLTTNKTIQKYNKIYRLKDKPTDILSFAFHENLKPDKKIEAKSQDDKNLGDLIISLEYVQKDAVNYGQTFEERLKALLVHGICHLLGYDHAEDQDYEIMQKKEKSILSKLK